jgi:transposase
MAGGDRKNADSALIAALAGGASVQAAAELCEVGESTIYRRLRDLDFRRRLTAARDEMVERAVGQLSQAMTDAAVTLRNLLTSSNEKIKLGAARAILEHGCRVRDSVTLAERVRQIEELIDNKMRMSA